MKGMTYPYVEQGPALDDFPFTLSNLCSSSSARSCTIKPTKLIDIYGNTNDKTPVCATLIDSDPTHTSPVALTTISPKLITCSTHSVG
jgi:hypothetical protein